MVYILFVAIMGSGTFTYEFKTERQCETALHNFKKRLAEPHIIGFCQEVKQ